MQQDIQLIGDSQKYDWREQNLSWQTDGVNDYSSRNEQFFPTIAPDTTFSFSVWVKTIGALPTNGFNIFNLHNSNGLGTLRNLQFNHNAFIFAFSNTVNSFFNGVVFTNFIRLGKWNHIVITNQGGNGYNASANMKVYVNRIDVTPIAILLNTLTPLQYTTPLGVTFPTLFGAYHDATDTIKYDSKKVCDFRVYDKVISPAEVVKLFHGDYTTSITGGLTMAFPLSNASDFLTNTPVGFSTIVDNSGNGRNFIISGQGTTATTTPFYP